MAKQQLLLRSAIINNVTIDSRGCWTWSSHLDKDGYGSIMRGCSIDYLMGRFKMSRIGIYEVTAGRRWKHVTDSGE